MTEDESTSCVVVGCGRDRYKRTWCSSCYKEWQRTRTEPRPFPLACVVCDGPFLSGRVRRNRRFCSKRCMSRDWFVNNRDKQLACIQSWRDRHPARAREIAQSARRRWIDRHPQRLDTRLPLSLDAPAAFGRSWHERTGYVPIEFELVVDDVDVAALARLTPICPANFRQLLLSGDVLLVDDEQGGPRFVKPRHRPRIDLVPWDTTVDPRVGFNAWQLAS